MNIIKRFFSNKPQPSTTEDLTARLLQSTDQMLSTSLR